MQQHTAVIALGSNLADPAAQIRAALQQIARLPDTVLTAASSLYRSTPVGYLEQPDFINAVCTVQTALDAAELLAALHRIEAAFGRERSFRNAPRTLDLDLIDYQGQECSSPELTLPHPRARERSFVMLPLAEIAPDYPIGGYGTARSLADTLGCAGIERLADTASGRPNPEAV